jgi:hypothetical protein
MLAGEQLHVHVSMWLIKVKIYQTHDDGCVASFFLGWVFASRLRPTTKAGK